MSPISSLMAAAEGPVAEFSCFANFEVENSFGLVKKAKKMFFASAGRFSIIIFRFTLLNTLCILLQIINCRCSS